MVSYDRNVVQFYGTCPYGNQTMLVLEYLEVKRDLLYKHNVCTVMHTKITEACLLLLVIIPVYFLEAMTVLRLHGFTDSWKPLGCKSTAVQVAVPAGRAFAPGPH